MFTSIIYVSKYVPSFSIVSRYYLNNNTIIHSAKTCNITRYVIQCLKKKKKEAPTDERTSTDVEKPPESSVAVTIRE